MAFTPCGIEDSPVPCGDRQNGGTGGPTAWTASGATRHSLTRSDTIMADKQLRDQHRDVVDRNRQQRLATTAEAQRLADQRNQQAARRG